MQESVRVELSWLFQPIVLFHDRHDREGQARAPRHREAVREGKCLIYYKPRTASFVWSQLPFLPVFFLCLAKREGR